MRLNSILIIAMTFWLAESAVVAQDFRALRSEVEQIVKNVDPNRKLLGKEERGKSVNYFWGSGKGKADIVITIFRGVSEQEAISEMAKNVKFSSVGPGIRIKDIGDEAYFLENEFNGSAVIRFRRASVFIHIRASSAEIAERLAKRIDSFIKTE